MIENKIKVFNELLNIFNKEMYQNKAYECLLTILRGTIEALNKHNDEVMAYTRYQLKVAVDGQSALNRMDSKDLGKWINDKKLNEYLNRVVSQHSKLFADIGYVPIIKTNETNGGKGNERRYWLDIIAFTYIENEDDLNSQSDENTIFYERLDPADIKLSWFYRFIFKNGEIKNRSMRGGLMLMVLFGGFIAWALYICAFALVLVRSGQTFTSFDLLLIIGVIGFSYWSFKYWFIPLWNLPECRVIKAPMTFISLNEAHADIEMYRDRDRNQLTRVTRFKAVCPICSSDVVLRAGKPDHNIPLIGRCVESPFSHTYSFDRVTLKGSRLSFV